MENSTNFGSLPTQSVTQPLHQDLIKLEWSEVCYCKLTLQGNANGSVKYIVGTFEDTEKRKKSLILPSCGFIPYTPHYEKNKNINLVFQEHSCPGTQKILLFWCHKNTF